jgi:hypothetical protein
MQERCEHGTNFAFWKRCEFSLKSDRLLASEEERYFVQKMNIFYVVAVNIRTFYWPWHQTHLPLQESALRMCKCWRRQLGRHVARHKKDSECLKSMTNKQTAFHVPRIPLDHPSLWRQLANLMFHSASIPPPVIYSPPAYQLYSLIPWRWRKEVLQKHWQPRTQQRGVAIHIMI